MDILGVVDLPWWLLLLCVCLYLYHLLTPRQVWRARGVAGPPPRPLLGTLLPFLRQGPLQFDQTMLRRYGAVAGLYEGATPVLLLHDPAMLREVLVKQFDCFTNRRDVVGLEGAAKDMLVFRQDDDWRRIRNLISPAFTSGKLRAMLPGILSCAEKLVGKMGRETAECGQFDTRKLCGAFTMDVIAYTAFGIDANCLENPDNEFVVNANKQLRSGFRDVGLLLLFFWPRLLPLLRWLGVAGRLRDPAAREGERFFRRLTEEILREREARPEQDRVDFVRLCLEANRATLDPEKRLTVEEIHAQALVFFLAGYETTNTAISFLAYNLAQHPDVQERLCEEIDRELGDQQVDFTNLSRLTYLEQCIHESMRLYSPVIRASRTCNRDTVVCGVPVRAGERVAVPILSVMRDPAVYPQPERFDPERFSPENSEQRDAFSWLAFGMGPRNCIGMRLAQLEVRVAMVTLLRRHRFVTVKDTPAPEQLTWTSGLTLIPRQSLVLGLTAGSRACAHHNLN